MLQYVQNLALLRYDRGILQCWPDVWFFVFGVFLPKRGLILEQRAGFESGFLCSLLLDVKEGRRHACLARYYLRSTRVHAIYASREPHRPPHAISLRLDATQAEAS